MKVLTVYAHPSRNSFCHAVLERFTAGLRAAGHTSEVLDLYAIGFDPVFRVRDFAAFVDENLPVDVLERMKLKQFVLDSCGGPVQRLLVSRWLRKKDLRAVAAFVRAQRPRDAVRHWKKVEQAQGLAFVAPVFWLHFPAILKGWFERVFAYGEAFALTREGWDGEIKGRVPLLRHEKALIISTTLFREEDYSGALGTAMTVMIDDWGLRYPGIKNVEHVFFYAVPVVDDETRRGYLERAYELGKDFAPS
jgi:NAD(P)H dehydrogenase (quinone)